MRVCMFLVLFVSSITAQVSQGGTPYSILHNLDRNNIPIMTVMSHKLCKN